jgi:hypothetical protein
MVFAFTIAYCLLPCILILMSLYEHS